MPEINSKLISIVFVFVFQTNVLRAACFDVFVTFWFHSALVIPADDFSFLEILIKFSGQKSKRKKQVCRLVGLFGHRPISEVEGSQVMENKNRSMRGKSIIVSPVRAVWTWRFYFISDSGTLAHSIKSFACALSAWVKLLFFFRSAISFEQWRWRMIFCSVCVEPQLIWKFHVEIWFFFFIFGLSTTIKRLHSNVKCGGKKFHKWSWNWIFSVVELNDFQLYKTNQRFRSTCAINAEEEIDVKSKASKLPSKLN